MKTLLTAWTLIFPTAALLTGCTGSSSDVVTPSDMTAEQEEQAKLEMQEVENEEMLHFSQQGQ